MYRPTGFTADLGDVEIIEKDGRLHLFHLVIPNRDTVGHIVSDDGMRWEVLPDAIHTGDPGEADDDMIRTVSVTEHKGAYYMLYSATARRDCGRLERTCLAVSTDLMHWEKHCGNPVLTADGSLYQNTAPIDGTISWRDPKPYFEDGVYDCLLCARDAKAPALRNGCVALASSEDLVHWKLEEPLFLPYSYHDIECPQVFKIGGYYFLIGSIIEDRSQRYWVAENLRGPYETPGDNLLMPPGSHYAGRIARFKGREVFACWNSSAEDGQNPVGVMQNPGSQIRNIPALLDVVRQGKRIWLSPGKNWEPYAKPMEQDPVWDGRILCGNATLKNEEKDQLLTCNYGMGIASCGNTVYNFEWKAGLSVNSARGGLTFYLEEDTSGYFIEFCPEARTVALIKHLPDDRRPRPGILYEERQSACLPDVDFSGMEITLRAVQGEIELSVNNRLRLSTFSFARRQGKLGLFCECGDIRLSAPVLRRLEGTQQMIQ